MRSGAKICVVDGVGFAVWKKIGGNGRWFIPQHMIGECKVYVSHIQDARNVPTCVIHAEEEEEVDLSDITF